MAAMIEEIGYHCRDYFLGAVGPLPAVSRRDPGAFDARQGARRLRSGDRRRVAAHPRHARDRHPARALRSINLGYLDPASVQPADVRRRDAARSSFRAPARCSSASGSRPIFLTRVRNARQHGDYAMATALEIPPTGALDFLALGALVHRLDPGVVPVPQGADLHDPRERRRIQHAPPTCPTASGARPASRARWSTTRSATLIAERVQAMGVAAVLQAVRARRRARPEHGDGLQRPRLRRARARGLLQPQQRGGGAAEARRLRLGGDLRAAACAGSTAAASSRRSRDDHRRVDSRGHAGRRGSRRRRARST